MALQRQRTPGWNRRLIRRSPLLFRTLGRSPIRWPAAPAALTTLLLSLALPGIASADVTWTQLSGGFPPFTGPPPSTPIFPTGLGVSGAAGIFHIAQGRVIAFGG